MEQPNETFRIRCQPGDIPDLVAFWDMQGRGQRRPATAGEPYTLHEMAGTIERVSAPDAPFGAFAAQIEEGQYFAIPRDECPHLNINGPDGHLTVIGWIQRQRTAEHHCEFIAGQWNETGSSRQYGLFLNIGVWGGEHEICGHVSHCGGPTPGYRYCMDGAIGATPVPWDEWSLVAMTYDGTHAAVWLDGELDRRDGINPYPMAGGLYDGGITGSDFTVGGVDRSGEMGNWFTGLLGGLAVYDRALTPAEMWAVCKPQPQ